MATTIITSTRVNPLSPRLERTLSDRQAAQSDPGRLRQDPSTERTTEIFSIDVAPFFRIGMSGIPGFPKVPLVIIGNGPENLIELFFLCH